MEMVMEVMMVEVMMMEVMMEVMDGGDDDGWR